MRQKEHCWERGWGGQGVRYSTQCEWGRRQTGREKGGGVLREGREESRATGNGKGGKKVGKRTEGGTGMWGSGNKGGMAEAGRREK